MNNFFKVLFALSVFVFLFGCTSQDILLVRQSIGADVNGFFDGNYDKGIPFVDVNTITFDPDFNFDNGTLYVGELGGDLNWSNLQNYPSACPSGTAVQSIGDTLTCVSLSDTNGFVTWVDANNTFAFKFDFDDLNTYVYNLTFNDTNWETSFTEFDSNLSETYRYYSSNYIDFNTNESITAQTGRMFWNDADGTIDIGLKNGSVLQTGQETLFYGKASGNILNGELVQFAGVQGDHILMKKVVASEIDTNPEYLLGVATQNINNNQFGYVTWFGKVNGVYTDTPNNNDSVDWSAGDILYFNPTTGQLTNVEPYAPNRKIIVAAVIKEQTGNAENGRLLVRPTFDKKLIDIDDVNITSITDKQALIYNASQTYWENTTLADVALNGAFLNLTDTPSSYSAKARYIPTVNDSETGLDLIERKELFITDELIINPSFENWGVGNDMPDNWTYDGTVSASSNVEKETTIAFNGGTSLKLKNLVTSYSSREITSDAYQVPATGVLLYKVYAYLPTTTTLPEDVSFRVRVSFYDSTMTLISTTSDTGQDFNAYNKWITFSSTANIPNNAVYAKTSVQAKRVGGATTDIIFDFASTVVSNVNIVEDIEDLQNVEITSVANKNVLQYDTVGSVWRNETLADAGISQIGHTHIASDINDFNTAVSANTNVSANTTSRHDPLTVTDSSEIDFTLTGQDLTASLIAGSIDENKLDTSVNDSLDLADSAVQPADLNSYVPYTGATTDVNIGNNSFNNSFFELDDSLKVLNQGTNTKDGSFYKILPQITPTAIVTNYTVYRFSGDQTSLFDINDLFSIFTAGNYVGAYRIINSVYNSGTDTTDVTLNRNVTNGFYGAANTRFAKISLETTSQGGTVIGNSNTRTGDNSVIIGASGSTNGRDNINIGTSNSTGNPSIIEGTAYTPISFAGTIGNVTGFTFSGDLTSVFYVKQIVNVRTSSGYGQGGYSLNIRRLNSVNFDGTNTSVTFDSVGIVLFSAGLGRMAIVTDLFEGSSNISVGASNFVSGQDSLSIGYSNKSYGNDTIIYGKDNILFGNGSLLYGKNITTDGTTDNMAIYGIGGGLGTGSDIPSLSGATYLVSNVTQGGGVRQKSTIVVKDNKVGIGLNNVGTSTLTVNGSVKINQDLNVDGTVYYGALESLSPHAFLSDNGTGTRICKQATDGVVLMEKIEKVNGEYKVVYYENQDECNKILLKSVDVNTGLYDVNGVPSEVVTTAKVYEQIWTKEQNVVLEEVINGLPFYDVNKYYLVGDIFRFDGETYEVLQDHQPQFDWTPDIVPALYKVKVLQEYGEIREWVQPVGASDCYAIGDKVTYGGNTWENTVACNVWTPGVYGWVII